MQRAIDPFGTCPLPQGAGAVLVCRLDLLCNSSSHPIIGVPTTELECGTDCAHPNLQTCCKIGIVLEAEAPVGYRSP